MMTTSSEPARPHPFTIPLVRKLDVFLAPQTCLCTSPIFSIGIALWPASSSMALSAPRNCWRRRATPCSPLRTLPPRASAWRNVSQLWAGYPWAMTAPQRMSTLIPEILPAGGGVLWHGERRFRRRRAPRLDPGHAAGLQFADDLGGDFVVEARPVRAGTGASGTSGHRGSPRRAPEAFPPALNPSRRTRPASSSYGRLGAAYEESPAYKKDRQC